MIGFIKTALQYQRTVLLLLAFFMVAGIVSYIKVPKEAAPDISIPMAVVSVAQKGISPQDAETLLVKPLEAKLRSLAGLKKMTSESYSGGAHIIVEFFAGLDIDKLLSDVRTKVDLAKSELPSDADYPIVDEVNLSFFPVISVQLTGLLPKKKLYTVARDLQDRLESLSQVMEVNLLGDRRDIVEIEVDPEKLTKHKIDLMQIMSQFRQNHLLVESGSIINQVGSFPVKVPGLIKSAEEILKFPIKSDGQSTLRFEDIGTVRMTHEDPRTMARSNGESTVVLEVKKRLGENIIETVEAVKEAVAEELKPWQGKVKATFSQDESEKIIDRLVELQNSIISAVILVMLVIIFSLGMRSALLVGVAVPGAFLMSLFVLYLLGITLNIVVLFSLILSVGMLVDGAIIVVEYADRKMVEGYGKYEAYQLASARMAWPVISSLVTVIVVFMPLLFWPGIVGEFMKYLPMTLIITLTSSLFMALVFIPTLGSLFGKVSLSNKKEIEAIKATEEGPLDNLGGLTGWYVNVLKTALKRPLLVIVGASGLLVGVFILYGQINKGVEFFPDIETDQGIFYVSARGNLSIYEKDKIVAQMEQKLLGQPEFKSIYATAGSVNQGPVDAIGKIVVELVDWQQRESASVVLNRVLKKMNTVPGVVVELQKMKPGPNPGKPINLEIASQDHALLNKVTKEIKAHMDQSKSLLDVTDDQPLPGIEWQIKVDRDEAMKFQQTIASIGSISQMLTRGLKIAEYRPDTLRDEVDVVIRFPKAYRTLEQMKDLRIPTSDKGEIPLVNFSQVLPTQKIGTIHRINSMRAYTIKANIVPGTLVADEVNQLRNWIKSQDFDSRVKIKFTGEEEDKDETSAFLMTAFLIAVFLIFLILVTQFNHFFYAFLVLTSIVFSTLGVLMGLMITGMPFGIVMGGLGVIALAGIIVSNNIIFIDTYAYIQKTAKTEKEKALAILRTGAQRLRPVLLTKLTTILGLLPIRLRLDIDFINGTISYGAPSTEWWIQLSNAIIFGALFASPLTLVLTPCALRLKERLSEITDEDKKRLKKSFKNKGLNFLKLFKKN
ncbi:MAG: MFS transporter [Rickettsiales bacterium]|nr:MFS transporter [Rickettsiales bacterium]|tara:strand:+ start:13770 stop:16952 length:3183 start_codon:yes stop_codon:yes gene_type:complete